VSIILIISHATCFIFLFFIGDIVGCWLSSLNVYIIVISNIIRSLKHIIYVTTDSGGKCCHVKILI